MEHLSQLHRLCEIEHDMGAFYSPVVSWLSSALIQYVALVTQEVQLSRRCETGRRGGGESMGYQINRIDMWRNVAV